MTVLENLTPHEKLVKLSQLIELPKAYLRDLYYHDRLTLERERWTHFLWMVRETGTELIPMRGEYLAGEYRKKVPSTWINRREHRIFWYNEQGLLREITRDEAIQVLGTTEQRIKLSMIVQDRDVLLKSAPVADSDK